MKSGTCTMGLGEFLTVPSTKVMITADSPMAAHSFRTIARTPHSRKKTVDPQSTALEARMATFAIKGSAPPSTNGSAPSGCPTQRACPRNK